MGQFFCVDHEHICDGTPLQECAALFEDCDQVFAVGVNCTDPQYVNSLIGKVRTGAPSKRIVVYPNSGQTYNADHRLWTGQSSATDFGQFSKEWHAYGATLIGGCCQTGADHMRAIRTAIAD